MAHIIRESVVDIDCIRVRPLLAAEAEALKGHTCSIERECKYSGITVLKQVSEVRAIDRLTLVLTMI